MTQEEIKELFHYDDTHKYIYDHLDDNTLGIVIEILSVLDKQDFKEFNPNAKFDWRDIPIPHSQLTSGQSQNGLEMTEEVSLEMQKLLVDINEKGTNKEYPYMFCGFTDDSAGYCAMRKMPVGDDTSCNYEWKWIEDLIKEQKEPIHLGEKTLYNVDMKIALFHTHPNPLGEKQPTLFNKYPKELEALGVKPNGLNLSLSDLYAQMYLEMLINKHNSNITAESLVLMHTGDLIAFSTQNGVQLSGSKTIEPLATAEDEIEM